MNERAEDPLPYYKDRRDNPWPVERLNDLHNTVTALTEIPNRVGKIETRMEAMQKAIDSAALDSKECLALGRENENTLTRIEQAIDHLVEARADDQQREREAAQTEANGRPQIKAAWIAAITALVVAFLGGCIAIVNHVIDAYLAH